MATRFYFPSAGSAPITNAVFNAGWNNTGSATRYPLLKQKSGTSMVTHSANVDATAGARFTCRGQFVFGPLAAQTISGTIKGQCRVRESNAAVNGFVAVAVHIVQPDGTLRGNCLTVAASDNTAAAPPEMTTTLTNRRFQDSAENFAITLTSQAVTEGDYLVVEVGWREADTNTARTMDASFGDNSATDLAEDNTTTTANNPWIEFSGSVAGIHSASAVLGASASLLPQVRTRLYFSSTTTVPITPAALGTWDDTASATHQLLTKNLSGSAGSSLVVTTGSGGVERFVLAGKYIAGPLIAQNIAGTIKGQLICAQGGASGNATLAVAVHIVKPDGTLRATLTDRVASNDIASVPPEFSGFASPTNRQMLDSNENPSIPLTAQNASEGDYLLVEIGIREEATSINGITIIIGDSNVDDLPEDNTTTANNNPWIEFSEVIAFQQFTQLTSKLRCVTGMKSLGTGISGIITSLQCVTGMQSLLELTSGGAAANTLITYKKPVIGRRPRFIHGINRNSIQARGLIGLWPLGMDRVIDITQQTPPGNVDCNVTVVNNNLFGPGFNTTGVGTPIELGDLPKFAFGSGDFSLCVWTSATAGGPENETVIGRYGGSGDDYWMGISGGDFYFSINSTILVSTAGSGIDYRDSIVHLFVGVKRNGNQYLYIDGVEKNVLPNAISCSPTGQLLLGDFSAAFSSIWAGNIYEARVYNRGLSATEVAQMYNPRTRWGVYEEPLIRIPIGAAADISIASVLRGILGTRFYTVYDFASKASLSGVLGTGLIVKRDTDVRSNLSLVSGSSARVIRESRIVAGQSGVLGVNLRTVYDFRLQTALQLVAGMNTVALADRYTSTDLQLVSGMSSRITAEHDSKTSLSGVAGITAYPTQDFFGETHLQLVSGMSAAAKIDKNVFAAMQLVSGMSTKAIGDLPAKVSLQLVSGMESRAITDHISSCVLQSVMGINATAEAEHGSFSVLQGVAGMSSIARVDHDSKLTLQIQTGMLSSAIADRYTQASLNAMAYLAAQSVVDHDSKVTLHGTASLIPSGLADRYTSTQLQGVAGMESKATADHFMVTSLGSNLFLHAHGAGEYSSKASLAAQAYLIAIPQVLAQDQAFAEFYGVAGMTADITAEFAGKASLCLTSGMGGLASHEIAGAADLSGIASLVPFGVLEKTAQNVMSGVSGLVTTLSVDKAMFVELSGVAGFRALATAEYFAKAELGCVTYLIANAVIEGANVAFTSLSGIAGLSSQAVLEASGKAVLGNQLFLIGLGSVEALAGTQTALHLDSILTAIAAKESNLRSKIGGKLNVHFRAIQDASLKARLGGVAGTFGVLTVAGQAFVVVIRTTKKIVRNKVMTKKIISKAELIKIIKRSHRIRSTQNWEET